MLQNYKATLNVSPVCSYLCMLKNIQGDKGFTKQLNRNEKKNKQHKITTHSTEFP